MPPFLSLVVFSVRTAASIYYFPKMYLCYFSLFHIYFFSFPFGFSYVRTLCYAMLCYAIL